LGRFFALPELLRDLPPTHGEVIAIDENLSIVRIEAIHGGFEPRTFLALDQSLSRRLGLGGSRVGSARVVLRIDGIPDLSAHITLLRLEKIDLAMDLVLQNPEQPMKERPLALISIAGEVSEGLAVRRLSKIERFEARAKAGSHPNTGCLEQIGIGPTKESLCRRSISRLRKCDEPPRGRVFGHSFQHDPPDRYHGPGIGRYRKSEMGIKLKDFRSTTFPARPPQSRRSRRSSRRKRTRADEPTAWRGWGDLFLAVLALIALPGCGLGGLLGAIVGGVSVAVDGGDETTAPTATIALAPSSSFDRDTLRRSGDAGSVTIVYRIESNDERGRAVASGLPTIVEFARASDEFATWRNATTSPARTSASTGEIAIDWHAAADLDLIGSQGTIERSERVRYRVRTLSKAATPAVSPILTVGNSMPILELLPSSDEEGEITLLVRARDDEEDALEDVRFTFSIGAGSPEVPLRLGPELPSRLAAPREAIIHSGLWDSRVVRAPDGRRNVAGVTVRVRARDAFSTSVESGIELDILNNHPPAVEAATDLRDTDASFEVPIPFRVFDADVDSGGDTVDVIIQYSRSGPNGFPELPSALDDVAARRSFLLDDEQIVSRRSLQIATPSERARPGERAPVALRADGSGAEHVLLWDSASDLRVSSRETIHFQLTPFDGDERGRSTISGANGIDNDRFSTAQAVGVPVESVSEATCGDDAGVVSAAIAADVDRDGRLDIVLARPEATDSGSTSRGRIEVYSRSANGDLSSEPMQTIYPGSRAGRDPQPLALAVADIDLDGRDDLALLLSYCSRCDPCDEIGEAAIFFGRESDGVFAPVPDFRLLAGQDARALSIADIDGRFGPDIVVANHDRGDDDSPSATRVFLHAGDRRFATVLMHEMDVAVEHIICGDILQSYGDDREEIAVFGAGRVEIVEWHQETGALRTATSLAFPSARAIAASDIDRDGRSDLVIGEETPRSAHVFLREPVDEETADTIVFRQASSLVLEGEPSLLTAVDLTRDGVPEIVALEAGLDLVEFFSRDEEGSWSRLGTATSSLVSWRSAAALSVGDVDGEGTPDLVIAGSRHALFVPTASPGSFVGSSTTAIRVDGIGQLLDLAAGDVDRDGRADLIVAASDATTVTHRIAVLVQTSSGTHDSQPVWLLERRDTEPLHFQAPLVLSIARGSDDAVHWIVASRRDGIDVWAGRSLLAAKAPDSTGSGPTDPRIRAPDATLELPGSTAQPFVFSPGASDIETSYFRLDRFSRRVIRGSLGLDDAGSVQASDAIAEHEFDEIPTAIDATDVDRDGVSDAVVLAGGRVIVLLGRRAAELTFEALDTGVQLGATASNLRALDVDADGRIDIVAASGPDRAIVVLRQIPEESATPRFVIEAATTEESPTALAVGDASGDDRPDILVAAAGRGALGVFYQRASTNSGDLFSTRPSWSLGADGPRAPHRVIIADLDSDRRNDIALLDIVDATISIVRSR
jgi:hypothetical protein